MTKIIKNLLTLADIENLPHFRLQECCLKELVESCKRTVQSRNDQAHIEILTDPETSYVIEGDVELLEIAIMNLLDNSVKYAQTTIDIQIRLERVENAVTLSIKDTGIGIPQQDLEHIFQRFYTVNKAHSKKLGGSGLGLSIVETIVEKHYGTVSVVSELGVGSTFTLRFPADLKNKVIQKTVEENVVCST
jgi:signal transduction histidine kinase